MKTLITLFLFMFVFSGYFICHAQTLTDAVNRASSEDQAIIQEKTILRDQVQARADSLTAEIKSVQVDIDKQNALVPIAQTADADVVSKALLTQEVKSIQPSNDGQNWTGANMLNPSN